MSKSFWEILSVYNVQIPIIQRDYAQGRSDEKSTAVRIKFLTQIAKTISTQESRMHLNFIYGANTDDHTVELIDGQQRFTTLFLVHWYLLALSQSATMDSFAVLKRFSYRTRESSRKFCEKICTEDNARHIFDLQTGKISERVINSPWFFLEWKNDPTVDAMLRTLDTIEGMDEFNLNPDEKWAFLTSPLSPITFEFLKIDNFGDSEDLYTKMNSRGKPLTDFENFKALFGKRLNGEIANNYWKIIDGQCSIDFWTIITERYSLRNIDPDRYYYSTDDMVLKFIWLQVEMYSFMCNANNEEFINNVSFYKNNSTVKPNMDFSYIEGCNVSYKIIGWDNFLVRNQYTPEDLIVNSLSSARDIVALIKELLTKENGLECWLEDPIDSLFAFYTVNNINGQVESEGGSSDFLVRILAFVIVFWCSAFGVPDDKKRLLGYLRIIRNSLKRYRSKKKAERRWDPELGKKECGKIVRFIVEELIDANMSSRDKITIVDCSGFAHFADEKNKEVEYYSNFEDDVLKECYALEDCEVLQGSNENFLGPEGPIISAQRVNELFGQNADHLNVSKALLAVGDSDNYFKIPSGEKANNNDRIALYDERIEAWSVALLYDACAESNISLVKTLVARMDNGESLASIISAYNPDVYTWQRYFIDYSKYIFSSNNQVVFRNGNNLLNHPTITSPDNGYGCLVLQPLARYTDDSAANVYIVMAVGKWCEENGQDISQCFIAATNSTITYNGNEISAYWENDHFVIGELILSPDNTGNVVCRIAECISDELSRQT